MCVKFIVSSKVDNNAAEKAVQKKRITKEPPIRSFSNTFCPTEDFINSKQGTLLLTNLIEV